MTKAKRKAAILQQGEQMPAESVEAIPLDDASDIAALAEQAPDVTQTVIDLEKSKVEEAAAQQRTADAVSNTFRANGFDPAIHEADAQGHPVLTPTGRFKKKGSRPARGAGNGGTSKSTLGGMPSAAGGENANGIVNAQTAAVVTTLKETALTVLVSDEFVMTPQEKATEVALLTAALNHSYPDGVPVNPWLAYSAAVVTHAAGRLGQPKTQTWLQRQKIRFATLYLKLKGRKLNAAHSGNGSHDVGENNSGGEQNQGAQARA